MKRQYILKRIIPLFFFSCFFLVGAPKVNAGFGVSIVPKIADQAEVATFTWGAWSDFRFPAVCGNTWMAMYNVDGGSTTNDVFSVAYYNGGQLGITPGGANVNGTLTHKNELPIDIGSPLAGLHKLNIGFVTYTAAGYRCAAAIGPWSFTVLPAGGCGAGTATWTANGDICSAPYSAMSGGGSATISSTNGNTGSVQLSCSAGIVTQSSPTCVSPSPLPATPLPLCEVDQSFSPAPDVWEVIWTWILSPGGSTGINKTFPAYGPRQSIKYAVMCTPENGAYCVIPTSLDSNGFGAFGCSVTTPAPVPVTTSTLKICQNSCDSAFLRGQGGATTRFDLVKGTSQDLVVCYNTADDCSLLSGDVTTDPGTVWNEDTTSNTISLTSGFISNRKRVTGNTPGTENFTAKYSGATATMAVFVTCTPTVTCSSQEATHCTGTTFSIPDNGCGTSLSCHGKRYCDYNWKEVAP